MCSQVDLSTGGGGVHPRNSLANPLNLKFDIYTNHHLKQKMPHENIDSCVAVTLYHKTWL